MNFHYILVTPCIHMYNYTAFYVKSLTYFECELIQVSSRLLSLLITESCMDTVIMMYFSLPYFISYTVLIFNYYLKSYSG